ncbi:MAG: YpdA family putative bacillithiol disulfide reductase [Acidobacteria bacterium]|nr:MAG: YpdA family putative bacillithiol disulfide reductase [Acidobacteriota bacterium]
MDELRDLIIVGAGPAGLACGIEAKRQEIDFVILEKGMVVNSLYHYPTHMTFFTTAELLEIGDVPMTVSAEKPKRLDGLAYYRRVADHFGLPIRDYEEVLGISGTEGDFRVATRDRLMVDHCHQTRRIIIATGYYANPNQLGIPGEQLSKVSHYYRDPHPYFRKKVMVVGGRNSAAIAALELYRNGASEVTLVHRAAQMSEDVKYWILPDINNRIKNREITAYFNTLLVEIRDIEVVLATAHGTKTVENDFVLLMTGYHPDVSFLRKVGIEIEESSLVPRHNPETLESNVKGIYLAGAILSGKNTNSIFIENGRFHGSQIFKHWPKGD